jgi:hypothetical protein
MYRFHLQSRSDPEDGHNTSLGGTDNHLQDCMVSLPVKPDFTIFLTIQRIFTKRYILLFPNSIYFPSCTKGTGGPFPGGKARPGRDADHSPPSSAEVVNE